jgi:hypothetical protein
MRVFRFLPYPVLVAALFMTMGATTLNSPSQQANPQPAFSDLSGSVACGQMPALTGAVTSSAGSCATSGGTTITQVTTTATTKAVPNTSGVYYDDVGAAGVINYTLPATPSAAQQVCFFVAVAQANTITANTGQTISVGTTTSASAGTIVSSAAIGGSICLYNLSGAISAAKWISVGSPSGTWTVN